MFHTECGSHQLIHLLYYWYTHLTFDVNNLDIKISLGPSFVQTRAGLQERAAKVFVPSDQSAKKSMRACVRACMYLQHLTHTDSLPLGVVY